MKYHWPKKVVKVGNSIDYRSIMFDEEWLDPHRVGNLSQFFQWQLSSTQYMGSEKKLSACITDVLTMKVPVFFYFFFQTKEGAGIAVESMLMNKIYLSYCWLDRTRVKYYKQFMWWNAGNEKTEKCLPITSITSKSRVPKQSHLEPSACPC